MAKPKSTAKTEYLAIAEQFEVQGPTGVEALTVIDAVPRVQLRRLRGVAERQDSAITPVFSPLLLVAKGRGANALREGEWTTLRISDQQTDVDTEFDASPLAFGRDLDNGVQRLWCRREGKGPSRSEMTTLRRLAEVRQLEETDAKGWTGFRDAAAVAVYDVGQASFSAIVDKYEHPVMFLDMGWPIGFNHKSRPSVPDFDPFALDRAHDPAPVVLSHLDWDHWGFVYEAGKATWNPTDKLWTTEPVYRTEALQRPWLLRRPKFKQHKLGPSHIHLIQKLRETQLRGGSRALQLYPSKRWSMPFGPVRVVRCGVGAGKSSSHSFLRNNEGLAVHVRAGRHRVLYCGDAEYSSIAKRYRTDLTGVVAPHHGGHVDLSAMPAPAGSHCVMAVSVSPGCYSNVPHAATKSHAASAGWSWKETSARATCPRGGCFRCNVHIPLGVPPACKCGCVPANCLCLS